MIVISLLLLSPSILGAGGEAAQDTKSPSTLDQLEFSEAEAGGLLEAETTTAASTTTADTLLSLWQIILLGRDNYSDLQTTTTGRSTIDNQQPRTLSTDNIAPTTTQTFEAVTKPAAGSSLRNSFRQNLKKSGKKQRRVVIDPAYTLGCIKEGYFPVSGSCFEFVHCQKSRRSSLIGYRGFVFRCPPGFRYYHEVIEDERASNRGRRKQARCQPLKSAKETSWCERLEAKAHAHRNTNFNLRTTSQDNKLPSPVL